MDFSKFWKVIRLAIITGLILTVIAPLASFASSKGRKNTAIGLTAGTVYEAIRGNKRNAIILGAGSLYAWKRYKDARDYEKSHQRRRGSLDINRTHLLMQSLTDRTATVMVTFDR